MTAGSTFIFRRRCQEFPQLVASLLLGLAGCAHVAPHPTADLAVVGATVIEPRDGSRRADQTVLVEKDRIVAVGDRDKLGVPATATRVDARGKFLIPGLWDMHVHALWDPVVRETFLPLLVANGITGMRDMGGKLDVLTRVRAEIAAHDPPWPSIVAAGPILDGPKPVDPTVSLAIGTDEEARAAVDRLAAARVDFIKVYTLLPPAAYRAVVEEAHARDLPVAGHIPYGIDAREAALGMRSVEHLRAETGGLCARLTPAECAAVYAAMREHHVWQTPTLVARRPRATIDDPSTTTDPRLDYVPKQLREIWLANRTHTLARLTPETLRSRRADFAREMADAGALPSRGLHVLAGSDAGADFSFPGFGLHEELALLVEAGLTPTQALQGATSEAADYLQRSDIGRIGTGAIADMVLLDADPLLDIRNTTRIRAVILRGRVLDSAALETMREQVRAAAQ